MHFCTLDDPQNQNFEKMKKKPGDIIILHTHTLNGNHKMYSSWLMENERQNFCHFRQFFALLPLQKPKNTILKKRKKDPQILSFYTCVPYSPGYIITLHKCSKNHDRMLQCSLDMACDRCNFYFSFRSIIFPFCTPSNPKNLEISFYTHVPKIMITYSMVPKIWCATDRRTDRKRDI